MKFDLNNLTKQIEFNDLLNKIEDYWNKSGVKKICTVEEFNTNQESYIKLFLALLTEEFCESLNDDYTLSEFIYFISKKLDKDTFSDTIRHSHYNVFKLINKYLFETHAQHDLDIFLKAIASGKKYEENMLKIIINTNILTDKQLEDFWLDIAHFQTLSPKFIEYHFKYLLKHPYILFNLKKYQTDFFNVHESIYFKFMSELKKFNFEESFGKFN